MFIYIYICICICIHIYIYKHKRTHTQTHTHTHTYTHTHTHHKKTTMHGSHHTLVPTKTTTKVSRTPGKQSSNTGKEDWRDDLLKQLPPI